MKPPICSICDKKFDLEKDNGGLVYFRLTPEQEKFNERFKQPGFTGHPQGAHWFCGEHFEKAKKLEHLTDHEALTLLNKASD